ncbi:hypothetical protein N431DRAFT_520194 [Stipitochalara longipes BDJ]|nr:hypothetical protein N431DRAFT_520194 [Stipitochalara longipes BDJ]
MRFFYISLLCCATGMVANTMHFTDSWDGIVAGRPFELTWEGNTGVVNITLNQGIEKNYTAVNTIATNINSTSYIWTPEPPVIPDSKLLVTLTDSTGATAVGAEFVIATNNSSTTTPGSNYLNTTSVSTASNSSTAGSNTTSLSATPSSEATDLDKKFEEFTRAAIGVYIGGTICFVSIFFTPLIVVLVYHHKLRNKKKATAAENAEADGTGAAGATGEATDQAGAVEQVGPTDQAVATDQVGSTDGANDTRPFDKRGLLGFWNRKREEKGFTGVSQVHGWQA